MVYKTDNGLTVYETFDELLKADVVEMYSFGNDYYIMLEPEDFYDEAVWKVDKRTEKVTVIDYVQTFDIPDEDKIPIDVEKFKKERTG